MTGGKSATQSLLDWWQAKRGARAMPARAELDPGELKAILPNLLLIDVSAAPAGAGHSFTCRLAGTEIDSRFGVPLTGRSLDQAPFGDARAAIRQEYEAAVAQRRPIFCSHSVVVGGRYVEYDRLAVPLSGKAEDEVTALAAAIDFRCAHPMEHARPPVCLNRDRCDRIDLCLAKGPPA